MLAGMRDGEYGGWYVYLHLKVTADCNWDDVIVS